MYKDILHDHKAKIDAKWSHGNDSQRFYGCTVGILFLGVSDYCLQDLIHL